ncbi:MAG: radical SAM protein, partial [Deltaproteobacteria bacterium]|nr:radical SAM protein [Deltaproteobacteria bacterium]
MADEMIKRHVYGPVPSRRLGLSLGVDLLPGKVCSYDCVYCQIGRTQELTTQRRCFFPPEEVLAEVQEALRRGPIPDVITIAGSGEPTLYRPLDQVILGLQRLAPGIPVVLITNGSLLHDAAVAREVLLADVLVPSLDAGDEATFRRINRPHPAVPFGRMLEGLQTVAGRHPGLVRMEVMLCAGINDDEQSLRAIAAQLAGLKLEAIEINSPVRPVTCEEV